MSYTFPVETSARHVHLTAEDFATLFGPDAQLTVKKELSIKGQFASNEKVTVVGPKKEPAKCQHPWPIPLPDPGRAFRHRCQKPRPGTLRSDCPAT